MKEWILTRKEAVFIISYLLKKKKKTVSLLGAEAVANPFLYLPTFI